MNTKQVQDFKISEIKWLNYTTYILVLKSTESVAGVEPGNFAEIKVPNAPDVFLRRPFSILDVDQEKNTLSFYIKIVGKGTRHLGSLNPGEKVSVIYPLGNSFSVNGTKNALLIGGGSGIAPFMLLGRKLKQQGVKVTFSAGRTQQRRNTADRRI
jgi:dihydroorotate dehydrogenase electron transfer subunit